MRINGVSFSYYLSQLFPKKLIPNKDCLFTPWKAIHMIEYGSSSPVFSELYAKSDLVVSIPHVLRWGYTSTIAIKQKIPAKMYIGIQPTQDPGLFVENVICLNGATNEYESIPVYDVFPRDKLDSFAESAKWLLEFLGLHGGFKIRLISDIKRGHGFGFKGTFCTLLTSCLYLYAGKISSSMLESYDSFVKSDVFYEINESSLRLDREWGGSPNGLLPYVGLINSDEMYAKFGASPITGSDTTHVRSLRELVGRSYSASEFPIDFGVISFGVQHDAGITKRRYEYFKRRYASVHAFSDLLADKFQISSNELLDDSFPVEVFGKFFPLRLLQALQEMILSPGLSQYVDEVIQVISDWGLHGALLERERYDIVQMYAMFDKVKSIDSERIGIVPISTGKIGGTYFFAIQKPHSRKTMENFLSELQGTGRSCFYQYLSRVHGTSSSGLTLHQFLREEVFSQFITKSSVHLYDDQRDEIVDYTKVISDSSKRILLDKVYMKLHVPGKKLTHKDIPSQTAAVEIMSILYRQKGTFVHNSELPKSSYSKSKNDMVGKIISPLQTLVGDVFGKELKVECTGNMYDFYVNLIDDDSVLSLVEPV